METNKINEESLNFVVKHYDENRFDRLRGLKRIGLSHRPKFSIYRLSVAAVALCIIGFCGFMFLQKTDKNDTQDKYSLVESVAPNNILPDGTIVTLYAKSSLTYNGSDFNNNRIVEISGSAHFNVKKTGNPFIVKLGKNMVEVLGTQFVVEELNDSTTKVMVEEGSVKVINSTGKFKTLNDGMSAIASNSGIDIINAEYHFVFENASLIEIIQTIEKKCNVTITNIPSQELCLSLDYEGNADDLISTINELFEINLKIEK